MFKVIEIKNKRFIFLPNSMGLYKYKQKIMDIVYEIAEGRYDENDENHKIVKSLMDCEAESLSRNSIVKKDYFNTKEIEISGCDLNLLYNCNLRCRYCFVNDYNQNTGGVLSKEEVREILDYVFEHVSSKEQLIITLMGGEPLMNMEAFLECLEYGNYLAQKYKKGVQYITTTNATLLNEDILSLFKKYNVGFIMSLDSHIKSLNDYLRNGQVKNMSAFDSVLNVIDCYKSKIDIHINVTITPLNLNIFETAKFLYERGVRCIHFYLCDSDRGEMLFKKEHIEQLKKEFDKISDYLLLEIKQNNLIGCYPLTDNLKRLHLKKPLYFPCSVLKNRVAFGEKGEIFPCSKVTSRNTVFGNIHTEIDYDKLSELRREVIDETKCKSCWARYLCGGECLGSKVWANEEQKTLRCELKRYIYALRLYIYDEIVENGKTEIFD